MGKSAPVTTAWTPGRAAAREVSIRTMRACGWGLRSSLHQSIRGRIRSSAKRVWPVTLATPSIRGSGVPTTWKSRSLPPFPSVAIQTLALRLRGFAAHAGGRQLHGFVDLHVSRAAAKIAAQSRNDLRPSRGRILLEECLRGQQNPRCAVTTLRRTQLGERVLQRMKLRACRKTFHCGDRPILAGYSQLEAGEDGNPVDQDGARPAFAELTSVLGAGELQVFAQHFKEGFLGGDETFNPLSVHP